MTHTRYSKVRTIHSLGPPGTNLEAASLFWRNDHKLLQAELRLHDTLEAAVDEMAMDGSAVLVACVVYPHLHTLVFSNLDRLEIAECFVLPTHNMVTATRDERPPKTIATHAAPQHLAPPGLERVIVDSNSRAAIACATGLVDACITTLPAAKRQGLRVLQDFGPVSMGFSVHVARCEPRLTTGSLSTQLEEPSCSSARHSTSRRV